MPRSALKGFTPALYLYKKGGTREQLVLAWMAFGHSGVRTEGPQLYIRYLEPRPGQRRAELFPLVDYRTIEEFQFIGHSKNVRLKELSVGEHYEETKDSTITAPRYILTRAYYLEGLHQVYVEMTDYSKKVTHYTLKDFFRLFRLLTEGAE